MYNIYVTNTTGYHVHVRVHNEMISAVNPGFLQGLDKLKTDVDKDGISSYLVVKGFCVIPPNETMPFAVDAANDGTQKYLCLCARSKLWVLDFEVNCARYGCVLIKSTGNDRSSQKSVPVTFHISQENPVPVWIPDSSVDFIGCRESLIEVSPWCFFGRSPLDGTPCKVTVTDRKISSIWNVVHARYEYSAELLRTTGHDFVRAKAGDHVPPNAVIAGASESDGSLFLGRAGGNTPCSVSTSEGKIKDFYYRLQGPAGRVGSVLKKIQSGEILILKK